MASVHPGPWVAVIGAHRSGTSAVTGALAALGLQGVDDADRMEWAESNPEHWESLAAALFDEDLLADLGGAWNAPPDPAATFPAEPDRARAAELMAAAYPGSAPPVWKDPRACLLLPFWREVLPGPLTAVFVWRDPLAVARSLHARDGMPVGYGLALWEWYIRSAAAGLAGVDTYVLEYAAVVADPEAALAPLVGWLTGLERFAPWAPSWDLAAAAASIDGGLRHQAGDPEALPADTAVLVEWLQGLAGPHAPFSASPPPAPTSWPEAMVAAVREELGTRRRAADAVAEVRRLTAELEGAEEAARQIRAGYEVEVERLVGELGDTNRRAAAAQAELDRITRSTSWRVTAPLRAASQRRSGR